MVSVTSAILFSRAAESFIALLGSIGDDQWESPALGVWNVRSLAGHTARAILTVENYLNQDEPGEVTIASATDYYTAVYAQVTDPPAVAARGVEAGIWLGDNPVDQVFQALERTTSLIDEQPGNRIVSIGGMGILLSEYLRTRVFELTVHTVDLSKATGVPHTVPDAAIEDALALAASIAASRGNAVDVLFALTGRSPLPEGFSVV
ncbi:MAG: mycothiol maleylpyruvate isomerase [Microbacteriaceae bacterium]|nr:mycothiol maleylpyruvate isomerase [Microbacteriaceae bacterium]